MRTCSEVMTKNPVYCLPGDRVAKVAHLMKSTDIGSVPIVEDEQSKRLVGIVTCRAEDDLEKALDAMSGNQLRRIPVVDDDGKIVGIIAQADVATRVNRSEATAAVVTEISRSHPK